MNDKNGVQRSRLIQFLLSPSSYPHSPSRVKYIQTHASDVFIVAPYVYKIKKPVDFGFLDYSTLEKRKYFCEREIELNRRLCCNTYLSVEKISLKDGAFKLGAGDETIECAVKMNLLPEEYFLHKLLKKDLVHEADFSRIAKKLADYYSRQVPRGDISKYGQPEDIKSAIYQNLALTQKFIGDTITSQAYKVIKSYSDNFFCNRSNLFRDRMENGWIKDCHGDLRLEHINLADENICIYDCIEFNNNFRYIDIASDVAFLAMDLDYNGYHKFSSLFIDELSRMMKDDNMHSVLDFYKCYRAYVRGKVESLKALESEVPEHERDLARKNAVLFFKLALKYALFGSKPVAIVVFGVIGSGKSTIAKALSEELLLEVISSDVVRKRISGISKYERKYEEYDAGIYSKDVTERTYEEMFKNAEDIINTGKSVILDASFSKKKWRDSVITRTQRLDANILFIQILASEKVIVERLIARESGEKIISDGRLEILDRFIREFDRPFEIDKKNLITIDTAVPLSENIQTVLTEILHWNLSYS